MTATAVPPAEAPASPRRSRLLVVVAIAVVVVVAAGVITAVKISFRYAHAAPLNCACGLVWGPGEHTRYVHVGAQDSYVATARPGHAQTFYVLVGNPAPVTQTILGPESHYRESAEPIEFAVARPSGSSSGDVGDNMTQSYTTRPVALPPGSYRWVRYTIHTSADGIWTSDRSEFWTDLPLRVRVGAFTRIERVPLAAQMVLEGH